MKSASVLVAACVLLLSGCSGVFAPDPTATPSATATFATAQCSPDTARFTWTSEPQTEYQAISVHSESYGTQEGGSAEDDNSPDLIVTSNENSQIIGEIGDRIETWGPVMLASLKAAGLAPDLYGSMYAAVDTTEFVPPLPHSGKYVRVVVASTRSFAFGVTCADGSTAGGTLAGPVPANIVEFTIHCDDASHPKDSPQKAVARAECSRS